MIILFIIIILLYTFSTVKESFKSYNSDFIPETGINKSGIPAFDNFIETIKKNIQNITKTNNEIPKINSLARSYGLIPNIESSNIDKLMVIDWIKKNFNQQFIKFQYFDKNEINYIDCSFYMKSISKRYVIIINLILELKNNSIIPHQVNYKGITTPLSIQLHDVYTKKNYNEIQLVQPTLLTSKDIDNELNEFNKRKKFILQRINKHVI